MIVQNMSFTVVRPKFEVSPKKTIQKRVRKLRGENLKAAAWRFGLARKQTIAVQEYFLIAARSGRVAIYLVGNVPLI
jgi:hypothetical protein